MAAKPNQFAQLADRLQLLVKKDKEEDDTMTKEEIMQLSFEELKHQKINFGKTHVGRTYLDMLTEPKYLTWFSRYYKDSQNVKHFKFLRFLQLHVEHQEVAKSSTSAKSAPKSKAKVNPYVAESLPYMEELRVPDGHPMPQEEEEFPSWEAIHLDEANHVEMQELKDRMSNLEMMLSQVVEHLSRSSNVPQ